MNNLLVWPLTENDKIIFSSQAALAVITCCDSIDLFFQTKTDEYRLGVALTGCQLSSFKKGLQDIIKQTKKDVCLSDALIISCSQLGHILVQIQYQNTVLGYFVTSIDIMKAWTAQLDLLEVVMQENENEKKTRGTGCC